MTSPSRHSAPSETSVETPPPEISSEAASEPPVQPKQESAPEPPPSAPNGRAVGRATAAVEPAEEEEINKEWYILKVQSNREESIREGLMRRVAVADWIAISARSSCRPKWSPSSRGARSGSSKRKLYPGYLVVHMEINEDTWFLVRETPGIGDFTGSAGKPTPMLPHEVQQDRRQAGGEDRRGPEAEDQLQDRATA